MQRSRRTVRLRGVLMGVTGAVTCRDRRLLVRGRRTPVRGTGIHVSRCHGAMRPLGPLQRLLGVQPGALCGLRVRR